MAIGKKLHSAQKAKPAQIEQKAWISKPWMLQECRNFRKTLFIRQKLSLGVK
jgi:hypothetical protein